MATAMSVPKANRSGRLIESTSGAINQIMTGSNPERWRGPKQKPPVHFRPTYKTSWHISPAISSTARRFWLASWNRLGVAARSNRRNGEKTKKR